MWTPGVAMLKMYYSKEVVCEYTVMHVKKRVHVSDLLYSCCIVGKYSRRDSRKKQLHRNYPFITSKQCSFPVAFQVYFNFAKEITEISLINAFLLRSYSNKNQLFLQLDGEVDIALTFYTRKQSRRSMERGSG